jgi:hypothetical protein
MSNDVIFATQIGFIFVVFGLYRLLVSQKDSVIEFLKEKNAFLSEQLR